MRRSTRQPFTDPSPATRRQGVATLQWHRLSRSSDVVDVQHAFYPPGYAFPLHDHDFAELFLVEQGRGRHCGPDGHEQAVASGNLACLTPSFPHHLAAPPGASCTFLNIAFPRSLFERLRTRYPDCAALWSSQWPAIHHRVGDHDRHALLDWAQRLEHPRVQTIEVHAFLLDVMARLLRPAREAVHGTPPAWLAEVIEIAASPAHFAEGVAAYARLSGRSGAHINRLVRRHYGVTANQLCNRHRMDYAALRLRHGDESIEAVIDACGFAAPAQFYRRFRERFALLGSHLEDPAQPPAIDEPEQEERRDEERR